MRGPQQALTRGAGLLVALALMLPVTASAQSSQNNESDLEFVRRMTQRVKVVHTRAEGLYDWVRQRSQYQDQGYDPYGPRSPASRVDKDDLRRIERKLRSIVTKAEKERKRLQAERGSKSQSDTLDRESIEERVSGLEKDLERIDRDLRWIR